MRTEDGDIIYECLNGKPQAFGMLVDKYKEGIYAFAYAELGDFQDAQDVTQEIFLQAYSDLRSLRKWESFVFWLYRIARRRCVQCFRVRSRRVDWESIENQDPTVMDAHSLTSYRDSQLNESLVEALDSLPEMQREVLMLYYFGGMNSKEIARAIGTSPGAIRVRLSRARAQLRKEMVTMMDTAFESQKIPAGFTLRIVEAVKHIKISPMPRIAGVPWGASLAAGIIIVVLSLNSHLRINLASFPMSSPLPVGAKLLEAGEIPVDVLAGSRMPPISGGQEDIAEAVLFAPTKASGEGRIVFARWDGLPCSIWVMDADGENERKLTKGYGQDPSWSPDGAEIAFVGKGGIYVMNADGTDIKQLTESGPEADDWAPKWSPDGKQVAFVRQFWERKGNALEFKGWSVHLVNADGSDVRDLGEHPTPDEGGGDPAWSPDGTRIAYWCQTVGPPQELRIWVMDVNGKNREPINDLGGDAGGPDWSPGGNEIVFCSHKDSWNPWRSNDIYFINADGTGERRLTQPGPTVYRSPIWSPDGTEIAFTSNQNGNWHLYVMNTDGSNIRQITNTPLDNKSCSSDWLASSFALEPASKLPTTWGKIKTN